jgi:hypothetical protein
MSESIIQVVAQGHVYKKVLETSPRSSYSATHTTHQGSDLILGQKQKQKLTTTSPTRQDQHTDKQHMYTVQCRHSSWSDISARCLQITRVQAHRSSCQVHIHDVGHHQPMYHAVVHQGFTYPSNWTPQTPPWASHCLHPSNYIHTSWTTTCDPPGAVGGTYGAGLMGGISGLRGGRRLLAAIAAPTLGLPYSRGSGDPSRAVETRGSLALRRTSRSDG